MNVIYLDNAATTAISPEVRAAMEPYLTEVYGNPSSIHQAGRQARSAIERAREQVARALNAKPAEILFTSGGTEADNAAIFGAMVGNQEKGKHLITTAMEHKAVLTACEWLEKMGGEVTYLQPDTEGKISADQVAEAIRSDTVLISVMMVNNETGAIQPIAEIGRLARQNGILFHTDAVQAAGVLELDVDKLQVDLLSLSGHKLHGPKGVGALYIRSQTKFAPLLHGGSQERKLRGGTENLPGIVGLGVAVERAVEEREEKIGKIREIRDRMWEIFRRELGDHVVCNSPEDAVPTILNVSFLGVSAERLLMNLDMIGIMAASGSACTSGSLQPSHVLKSMGLDEERVRSAIRFSFSGHNTLDEVSVAAEKICTVVRRLRRQ
jgi:cysteine desulfurase